MKVKIAGFSLLVLIVVLLRALPAAAASSLVLSNSGAASYILQGVGMENVAALDVTITYSTRLLDNPRLMQGPLVSGAMTAINTNTPGTIRVGIVTTKPITGTGIIAAMTFDGKGNAADGIESFKASITNINGGSLPVLVQIINPAVMVADSSSGEASQAPILVSAVPARQFAVQPATTAVITKSEDAEIFEPEIQPAEPEEEAMPQENPVHAKTAAGQENKAAPQSKPQQETKMPQESKKSDGVQTKAPARTIYAQKSILQKFSSYKGYRTPKGLTALFNQDFLLGFTQEPSIVLSDGSSLAKISFIAMNIGNNPPKPEMTEGSISSLVPDPDNTNTWIANVKPDKGAYATSFIVPQEKLTMQFPLTVAPKANVDLDNSGTVTENDFLVFLKGQGTLQLDLNGDGKRDYIDDYIFAANFIVERDKSKPVAEKGISPDKPGQSQEAPKPTRFRRHKNPAATTHE